MIQSDERELGSPAQGASWRKSSFSGDQGSCVEVAWLGGGRVGVRDSKRPDGGMLVFGPAEFTAFLTAVKAGGFDQAD